MEKGSYEKGLKKGYLQGVQAAKEVIKNCEKDPTDITRLSLLVIRQLDELERCD